MHPVPAAYWNAAYVRDAADGISAPLDEASFIDQQLHQLDLGLYECWVDARHKDLSLHGGIFATLEIDGDPVEGGTVVSSLVDPARSTITDPTMGECVQETAYAVKFPPPRYQRPLVVEQLFRFGS